MRTCTCTSRHCPESLFELSGYLLQITAIISRKQGLQLALPSHMYTQAWSYHHHMQPQCTSPHSASCTGASGALALEDEGKAPHVHVLCMKDMLTCGLFVQVDWKKHRHQKLHTVSTEQLTIYSSLKTFHVRIFHRLSQPPTCFNNKIFPKYVRYYGIRNAQ